MKIIHKVGAYSSAGFVKSFLGSLPLPPLSPPLPLLPFPPPSPVPSSPLFPSPPPPLH